MSLNIHPIFVHFPVALLTIYSLMELVRFNVVTRQPYWFYIKASFAILGSLSTGVAWLTGDSAGSLVRTANRNLRPLVEMHSHWADVTVVIFIVLAFGYLVAWIERDWKFNLQNKFWARLWSLCLWLKKIIFWPPLTIVLALAGLLAVTITGSLGGAIAYGSNVDPIVHFVYSMFFK